MSIPPPPLPQFLVGIQKQVEEKEKENMKKKEIKYIGLKNQGATCYLNSLIQTLFMTPEFRSELFKWNFNPELNGSPEDSIPLQLQKLFYRLQEPLRKVEETKNLTKSFQWSSNDVYVQQDIQELCRVLFEAIELSIFLSNNNNNFIKKLYEGKTKSVIRCCECGYESFNTDTFMDLSLPIMNMFEGIYNKSLEMAFMNLIKPENLDGDNKYFCEKCNKKVKAEKYTSFENFPKILFLQLGRFYYDFTTEQRQKINDRVPFPLILNCNKFMKEYKDITYNENESEDDAYCLNDTKELIDKYLDEGNNVYELFSIVIQSGSANGGHYYAYIKSFEDGEWYCFNDGNVDFIDKNDIKNVFGEKFGDKISIYKSTNTAYYLSYRKIEKNEKKWDLSLDMKISDNLRDMCKEENIEIIENEKIEQEKKKFQKIGVNPNKVYGFFIYTEKNKDNINNNDIIEDNNNESGNENDIYIIEDENENDDKIIEYDFKVINLIGKQKTDELISEIYKEYNYSIETQQIIKFREFDSNHSKKGAYIEIPKDEYIGKFASSQSTSLFIQFPLFIKNKIYKYPKYDPTQIYLNIIKYPENIELTNNFDVGQIPKKKIKASTSDTLNNMTKKICDKIGYKYEDKNLYVIKKIKTNFGGEDNYYVINKDDLYSDKIIAMELLFNNSELYVEQIAKDEKSKWDKYLEKFKPKVAITFNNINPVISQKELTIFVNENETVLNIKKEIINVLNNPDEFNMDNIILKENDKKGKEIKDMNSTLEKYFVFNNCKIYIEKGTPLKLSEKELIIFFCEFDYEKFNFYPYKFSSIKQRLIIDENKTIKDLKNEIMKNIENIPELKDKFDKNKNHKSNILIRKINRDYPSKIFFEEQIIKKIIENDFDLSRNIRLCIQIIPEELFDTENIKGIKDKKIINNNILELSLRYFDFSTWNLTEPIELLIQNDITYEELCSILLKHYPHLDSYENIQIIKLVGGYKTYLDTMLKFKPYTLVEYLDSKIEKYPLFLNNDGKMLVIKDKRIEAKEPNEEIKKYGFEPLDEKISKNTINYKDINSNASSGGKVKQMIELFNKAEFDPVNRVHTDINYLKENKNKYKTKEKGIKIKIKMLENTENKEEKNEQKEEISDNNKNSDIKNEDKNKVNEKEEICDDINNIESEGIEPLI